MKNNVQKLYDTLDIFNDGMYIKNGKTVQIKLSKQEMRECYVYLPDNVKMIIECRDFKHPRIARLMQVGCRNIDSFGMALEQNLHRQNSFNNEANNILVLNFANPYNPGGGVRNGANAQEEDLCRKSSLLFSLESEDAQLYYKYNKLLKTNMGSDAIILSPNVEIIKDCDGRLLDESVIVSVMTCAAPIIVNGMGEVSIEQYRKILYNRICGMLKCAAHWGYEYLVLGAFGCGAFGNDAKLVSDLFHNALKNFNYGGMKAENFFSRIDFAILDKTQNQYNLNEFKRNFENYYND